MRFIPIVGALLSLALSTGCGILGPGEFVDFDAYEPLPQLSELEFPETAAGDDVVYWELRRSWGPGSPENDEVLLTGGLLSRSDLDAELLATFDSASSFDGFANSCLPGWCPAYLVSIDKTGSVDIWDEPEGMQSILTPLESLGEAALIAFAFDYKWFPPIETGAFRRVDDTSWKLVVTKLVEFCDPIRTDRFLLRIEDGGQVTILKQEEYQSDDGICI